MSRTPRRTIAAVTAAALAVLVASTLAPTPASAATQPALSVRSSDHLAGYARRHAPGFTGDANVNGTFRVPRVDCTTLTPAGGAVTIWIGVDGFLSGSTVQLRAGVQITCAGNQGPGAYKLVWSQAPGDWRRLATTVPGHKVYVFVSSDPNQPVNVIDQTTGALFSGGTGTYRTDHTTVECMVDTVGRTNDDVAQPDFGEVVFSSCNDFSTSFRSRPLGDPTSAAPGESTYRVQNRSDGQRSRTSPWRADHTWAVTWLAP